MPSGMEQVPGAFKHSEKSEQSSSETGDLKNNSAGSSAGIIQSLNSNLTGGVFGENVVR